MSMKLPWQRSSLKWFFVVLLWPVMSMTGQAASVARPFEIHVLDQATSRGIPQVILLSSLNTRHVTDSNGLIAFNEPVAMGQELFFTPASDGYHFNAPGLAMGGVILKVEPGSSATIVMGRDMIAERLYRITGAGIYRDTVALGGEAPIAKPMINAGVIGQDSALCTVYQGRLFWIWGDTSRMRHPLAANFRGTGAFSDLPSSGGLAVDQGIDLHYITQDEFTKPMIPKQAGQVSDVFWLSCLMTVPDSHGHEHLLAWCDNIEGPSMKTLGRQIVEFDDARQEFHPIADYPTTAPLQPGGHAITVPGLNGDYMLFTSSGGSQTRVRKSYEAAIDPTQYEGLTCLKNDGPFSTTTARIARDKKGRVVYSWRKGAAAMGGLRQKELLEAGLLKDSECILRPVDSANGKPIRPHACSIAYNDYRKRWTMILSELGGTSMLGEIWYLEADQPEGPWLNALKVVTHDHYSFYNPLQHPELLPPGDHHIYFEGTYTKTFSDVRIPTPYYDYNQVMYRISLDDPRLQTGTGDFVTTQPETVVLSPR